METGVEKIVLKGGEPAPRKTGVNRILELLGGEPAKNKTGVDRIVEILEEGGGGGGSSLPSYSSSDIGKVLTVGEGSETVQTVIVPEQNAEFIAFGVNARAPLVNVSFDGLTEGDAVSVIVNGITYSAEFTTVTRGVGVAYSSEGYSFSIYYEDRFSQYLFDDSNASSVGDAIAISATASVPSVEPKWEAASGGGLFIVTADASTGALDKNYNEISSAMSAGVMPVVSSEGLFTPIIGTKHDGTGYSVYAVSAPNGQLVALTWTAILPTAPLNPA